MNFLTVVERELRVAARRKQVRRSRMFVGVVGVIIVAWFLLIPSFNSSRDFGQALFLTLSITVLIAAGVFGFSSTADCLSEEKREGTLGLLFLTDLKGVDVIVGKLVANSLSIIYGILAVFPVLAISLLAGGVSGTDVSRIAVVTLNLLFLSLSLGMMTSVIYQQGAHSLAAAALIFLTLAIGLPLGLFIAQEMFGYQNLDSYFLIPCPAYTCILGFPRTWGGGKELFELYLSLGVTHLMGWAFLLFSMMWIGRSWQDRVQVTVPKSVPTPSDGQGARPKGNAHLRFRQRLLEINPYLWRAARPHYRSWMVWAVLIVALGIFIWGWTFRPRYFRDSTSYFFMVWLLNTILKLWVAVEAPGPLSADRQNGALELLLVTPLNEHELTRGLRLALRQMFLGPTAVVIAVTSAITASAFLGAVDFHDDRALVGSMFLVGMGILILDLLTLGRLGHAFSLTGKSESRAISSNVFLILVSPWIIYFVCLSAIGLLNSLGIRFSVVEEWEFQLLLWTGISVTVDVLALRHANRILPARLRAYANARFEAR